MIAARRGVVIATGSQPAIPPISGLVEVDYWTTHDVISATELPDSLVVLGGGAVGCELGQLLARFGVDVAIVEATDRLLAAEELEASAVRAAQHDLCLPHVPRQGRRALGAYGRGVGKVLDPDYDALPVLDTIA